MQKVEIKLIGSEISGDIYITKRGTYLCDVNFNYDNPYFCTMTRNDFDGEPNVPVRDDIEFVIVDKFSDE
jgi:hypothetical protein